HLGLHGRTEPSDRASAPPRGRGGLVRIVGYARVSTEDQATNGASLDVQVAAITRMARERSWSLVHVGRRSSLAASLSHGGPGSTASSESARADAQAGSSSRSSTASLAASSRGLAS